MAALVVYAGLTPAAYWSLTGQERDAIVRTVNQANRRR